MLSNLGDSYYKHKRQYNQHNYLQLIKRQFIQSPDMCLLRFLHIAQSMFFILVNIPMWEYSQYPPSSGSVQILDA